MPSASSTCGVCPAALGRCRWAYPKKSKLFCKVVGVAWFYIQMFVRCQPEHKIARIESEAQKPVELIWFFNVALGVQQAHFGTRKLCYGYCVLDWWTYCCSWCPSQSFHISMCMGSASIICCPHSAALVLNQKRPGQEPMHRMQTAPAQTSPSTRKSVVKLFYAISVLSVLSVMSIGFDDQMWLANTKPSLCNFRGGEGHDGPARAIWARRCEMDLGFSSVCSSKILLLFSYVTALQPVSLNSQELCMCVHYLYNVGPPS